MLFFIITDIIWTCTLYCCSILATGIIPAKWDFWDLIFDWMKIDNLTMRQFINN